MNALFIWHAAVEPEYRKLFKELSKEVDKLIVITPKSWIECGRLQKADNTEEDNYSLVSLPVIFSNRIKGFFYPNIWKLSQMLRSFEPDIVHIFEEPYSLCCLEFVVLTKMFSPKAKIVVESFENMFIKQKFPFSFVEKFVLKNAGILITIPQEGETIWRKKGFCKEIKKSSVGIDENLFRKTEGSIAGYEPLDKKNKPRIAYIGRITPEKGLELLIESFGNLCKDFPECELLIVGNGEKEYKDALQCKITELGVKDSVYFIGAIETRLLPILYSKIDILVLPSLTTPYWKEQFGRVLIEAMACEAAVVGSSSGEIPNVIGDAGIVFPEGDVRALTETLKKLVTNDGLRRELEIKGRERVLNHFTWESIARRLREIYSEVLC